MTKCRTVLLAVVMLIVVGGPATAKMLPLEVQITDRSTTVRVAPPDFLERVNRSPSPHALGVFTEAERPSALNGEPLDVTLFTYAARSGSGEVHESLTSDAERQTYVAFDYYRDGSSAVGEVRTTTGEPHVGDWVRFSPAFVDLVEDALDDAPAAEPVSAPPYEPTEFDRGWSYVDYFVPLASLAVCVALLFVLWALRQSRKARIAQLGIDADLEAVHRS